MDNENTYPFRQGDFVVLAVEKATYTERGAHKGDMGIVNYVQYGAANVYFDSCDKNILLPFSDIRTVEEYEKEQSASDEQEKSADSLPAVETFSEHDKVELLVEDERYTSRDVHKGDQGILFEVNGEEAQVGFKGIIIPVALKDIKKIEVPKPTPKKDTTGKSTAKSTPAKSTPRASASSGKSGVALMLLIGIALCIGGLIMAITGFGYKESETSKTARTMQTYSDYYGSSADFSKHIDKKASGYAWRGIGGIAVILLGAAFIYGAVQTTSPSTSASTGRGTTYSSSGSTYTSASGRSGSTYTSHLGRGGRRRR